VKSLVLSAYICSTLLSCVPALAQMTGANPLVLDAVGCDESPTPGKRPANVKCAVRAHKNFDALPPGPLAGRSPRTRFFGPDFSGAKLSAKLQMSCRSFRTDARAT